MKDPTEAPPRYADAGAPEGRLLDLLRAPEMSAEQIARGERRITELAKAPPAPKPTGTGVLKIAALVALVVAPLATYGLRDARDGNQPLARLETPEPPSPPAPVEVALTPAAPARAPAEAAPTVSVDSLPAAIESAPSAPKLVDSHKAAPPRAPNDRLAAELALLDHARIALGTDPKAALRDVDRHAQDFPDGQLVAQREVIAVDALQRLGRTSEARARGKAFAGRFPDTSAARRIDSLLNGPPAAARP
ncbi:hypothetical protein AKJ09_05075 [Labilithrix luteola]|uniref:Uncharacterized protein n=1 Tax=Labilithrix luteola TaxID=1391654 RepID=A0A0K1PYF2_9BACT|nr:hypothetical protein [Labilithrix luteola]AKU98411.1 hypothetical protein AKJ09_05075 [Labilithrix luteola]